MNLEEIDEAEEIEGENSESDYNDRVNRDYLIANIRRDEELIQFIDDFINSQEFHLAELYVKRLNAPKPYPQCICTECWVKPEEKVDLVKEAQKLWDAERRFERFIKCKFAKKITGQQEKSIQTIREKIAEAKAKYLCHAHEREILQEKRRQKVLHDLKALYYVDTSLLSTKSKTVDKVLAYNKVRHMQPKAKRERMINIIRKILNEYKRQRQIDELKERRYDTKVFRRGRIHKSIEIVGTKIDLSIKEEPTEIEEEEEQSTEVPELEPQEENKDKKTKPKDEKEDKKDIEEDKTNAKGAKNKADDKKNEKADKKGKNENEEVMKDLVLPYIPQNKRRKLISEGDQKMDDLIQEFQIAGIVEENRENLERKKEIVRGLSYPEDLSLYSHPKTIDFQGFQNGVVYRKRLKIYNGGQVEKKCRFSRISLEEFNPLQIEVEPIGAQSIIPGLNLNVTITFTPEALESAINGKLIFLTYQSSNNEYLQISIPISCIPSCSHLNVTPEIINFDPLPIWKAKEICEYRNYKILKLNNTGVKPCRITINRLKGSAHFLENASTEAINQDTSMDDLSDQLDDSELTTELDEQNTKLESSEQLSLGENESGSEIISRAAIDECVRRIFSNTFLFSRNFMEIEKNSEKRIKVYFRNVDHVGYYNEKYLINVFEKSDVNNLECIGSQVCLSNDLHQSL